MRYIIQGSFFLVAALLLAWLAFTVFKKDRQTLALNRFHNAIKHAYKNRKKVASYDDVFAQLAIDYEKIVQQIGVNEYTSTIDMLKEIYFRYDTYSDTDFRGFFKQERDLKIKDFVFSIYKYITNDSSCAESGLIGIQINNDHEDGYNRKSFYVSLISSIASAVIGIIQVIIGVLSLNPN